MCTGTLQIRLHIHYIIFLEGVVREITCHRCFLGAIPSGHSLSNKLSRILSISVLIGKPGLAKQ